VELRFETGIPEVRSSEEEMDCARKNSEAAMTEYVINNTFERVSTISVPQSIRFSKKILSLFIHLNIEQVASIRTQVPGK
jgi:hypothetical protein